MDHTDILIRAAREAIGMLMALEGIRAADDARRQLAGAINAVEEDQKKATYEHVGLGVTTDGKMVRFNKDGIINTP